MFYKIITVCLGVFFAASYANADALSCIGEGDYTAASILLIDGSDSSSLDQSFEQSAKVLINGLAAKERLIVGVITERRATVKILIDMVRPEESIWESKLVFQKKNKDFISCVGSITAMAKAEVSKGHNQSAILETLTFAKEIFSTVPLSSKRLLVYSDMIQHSDSVSFYKLSNKDTAKSLMTRVTTENLKTDLSGVKVRIAGVGGAQNDKTARIVEEFWRNYFAEAGANLEFYGPVLMR